ncbi:hypothetical protein L5515_019017 [Caenorhabditis briggsae]|uniref:ABC transporter domain-containing protein n=1 Tax=Caenorhabditis briggsae TaxID=6238 RepID=A0AAE9FHV0_CAEBR|nr:hypothetical protein L5515_019017 [Caenorhabditis briggsae]
MFSLNSLKAAYSPLVSGSCSKCGGVVQQTTKVVRCYEDNWILQKSHPHHESYPRIGLQSCNRNSRTNILNGISLSIEPGKTVALVGPRGNGKSTLVSLLQLFYSPQSGRILLDGTPIQQIDHRHYHTKIALVAQEQLFFPGPFGKIFSTELRMEPIISRVSVEVPNSRMYIFGKCYCVFGDQILIPLIIISVLMCRTM